ncbi:MAG: hypothetical protein ACT4O9_04020 [Blastocatellia bacterium]
MLSFLTQPSLPKAALGLERGTITALSLQREGRGQFGVRQAATIDLPNNVLVPSFLDRNIISPEQFRFFLDEAVTAAGLLNQKAWSVSLPSNAARSAILTLENGTGSKNESEEILDWKSEQSFGAPASELRINRQKISPDDEGRTRYFATAAKLSVIDEYESTFEMFGWKAGLILPRAVSETNWLTQQRSVGDRLLISSQADGFTAFLLRGNEPTVVRTVTCTSAEQDDEIYRLLMFYNDRFADESKGNFLHSLLAIGEDIVPAKIREISSEALGRVLNILKPEDVGLYLPASGLNFDDIAAPAGLASLGVK